VDPAVLAAGGSGRTRWVGVWEGMGVFCVAYTMALPFVLHYMSSDFKPMTRWLNRLGLPFLLLAIFYTGSRGGFLATLAVISLHLAVIYKVSLKSILIAAAIVVVAFTAAPPSLTQTKDTSGSAQDRVDVWAQGLSMVVGSPAWGVGAGNFQEVTGTLIAHNSAIQMMGETGLIGLFLWVSLITACLRAAFLRYQCSTSPPEKRVVAGVMASVLGYVVSSMFVTLEYETFYMLLALCAGLTVAGTERRIYRRQEFLICGGFTLVFVVAIKALVMVY
jgi:O-antigen ligase